MCPCVSGDNAFEELAGHLLARMRGLRALHLCISYVPELPSLIRLTHLELHAVVFNGVQVRADTLHLRPSGTVACVLLHFVIYMCFKTGNSCAVPLP